MLSSNPASVVLVKEGKKFPSLRENKFKFGLNPEGKIDFFRVGPELDVDDLNLDALAITSNDKPKSSDGISKEMHLLYTKFSQVGLLYHLSRTNFLFPGGDIRTDALILNILRENLSDNIANPDEVVQEFVQRWNEIASLDIAKANLRTEDSRQTPNRGPFIYHLHFEYTLKSFLDTYATAIMNMPSVQAALIKDCINRGHVVKSFEEIPQSIVAHKKSVFIKLQEKLILYPEPYFNPSEEVLIKMRKRHVQLKKYFNPKEPYDQKLIDALFPSRAGRTYAPIQESKDAMSIDKRDRSPSRAKDSSTDAQQRRRDRPDY